VALKLQVYRMNFFRGVDMEWNILDLMIVVFGLLELLMWSAGQDESILFRFLRVFKVLRTLRGFRLLQIFRDMRLMMLVVVRSTITLCWACLLLAFFILVFSCLFIPVVTPARKTLASNPSLPDDEARVVLEHLKHFFGSVFDGMSTLFQCSTGGVDWGEVFDVLAIASPSGALLLICFIVFFQVAVFNIITSIFVDKARKLAQPDTRDTMQEQIWEDAREREDLRKLVEEVDVDKSGSISFDELDSRMQQPEIRKFFELQGLKVRDVKIFFKTLVHMSPGCELTIDDFVEGCIKVKGQASSLDMQAMKLQLGRMHNILEFVVEQLHMCEDPTQSASLAF